MRLVSLRPIVINNKSIFQIQLLKNQYMLSMEQLQQQSHETTKHHRRGMSDPQRVDTKQTGPPRSTSKAVIDRPTENNKAVKKDGELNPQMMKALKLFAKNHQELEKVSDPEKGNNRRVLSYDGRRSSQQGNIPASTFEKCGGTIPSGPKFVNELVEKELATYKVEVELKFKQSPMNNQYIFARRKSAVPKNKNHGQIATTVPPTPTTQVKQKIAASKPSLNDGMKDKTTPSSSINLVQSAGAPRDKQTTSASPQSRAILPLKKQLIPNIISKTPQENEHHHHPQQVLFTRKNLDLSTRAKLQENNILPQSSLRCESLSPEQSFAKPNDESKQHKVPENKKISQSSLSELLLDDEESKAHRIPVINNISKQHVNGMAPQVLNNNLRNMRGSQGMVLEHKPLSSDINNMHQKVQIASKFGESQTVGAPRTSVHSPAGNGQHKSKINEDMRSALIQNNQNYVSSGKATKLQQKKSNVLKEVVGDNHSVESSESGFFSNINQAFNKTVLTPPTSQANGPTESNPRNQTQHHSNGPPIKDIAPSTSIVINKPIVIQFQNKKITFKNHHHHHHHHHHHGGATEQQQQQEGGEGPPTSSSQSNRGSKASKSNPITKKTSPNQLSPRITNNTMAGGPSKNISSMNTSNFNDESFPPNPIAHTQGYYQTTKQQSSKIAPNQQQKMMMKMKKPPLQSHLTQHHLSQHVKPSIAAGISKKSDSIVSGNNQFVCQPKQIQQSSQVAPKGKKNQVNQILQQILSFDPSTSINHTQPPSPKSIEFSTQQVQQRDDGSLGRKFQITTSSNGGQAIQNNSLGRPRQSGNPEIGNNLANGGIKINNIGSNFGISKTQDSKKPNSKEGSTLHHAQGASYMADYNILEQLRNPSNENISHLGGRSDQIQNGNNLTGSTMMINNSSFTSNFRTQIPTGAKLILSNPQVVSDPNQRKVAKHARHQTMINQPLGSPTHGGMGNSLTIDHTKANGVGKSAQNRSKIVSNSGGNSGSYQQQLIHQMQQLNNSRVMSSSKTIEKPNHLLQTNVIIGKTLKKKKTSIGSSAHQTLRNTSQGAVHQSHNTNLTQQQLSEQILQSTRLMKKNQISQQQHLAKIAHDRHMNQMKEQLIKAAYHTSFNSPNRLSQHHVLPGNNQNQFAHFQGVLPSGPSVGLSFENSMDERNNYQKSKVIKTKQTNKTQHHSLSNSRKMSASRGPSRD